MVEDTWTGQSFTLKKNNKKLFVVWKKFGSGVPVVSEVKYPVTIKSKWQYIFFIPHKSSQNEVKVSIHDKNIIKVYINNIRIYAKKMKSQQVTPLNR